MNTVAELVSEIRKPGKILMPILLPGDVTYLFVEKSDLLSYLDDMYQGPEPAPWYIVRKNETGTYLDVKS